MYVTADRDVMEIAKEIVTTITDPQGMVGPEVHNAVYFTQTILWFDRKL